MLRVKLLIIAVLLVAVVLGSFAQEGALEAKIRELSGTVELKQAGSAAWENAVQGQSVAGDTTLSTGFKSSAVIAIGESLVTVRPLTRLSITEISSRMGVETINMSLQTGRVRPDVKPSTGNRTAFAVQTPPATASVRGTIFEVDAYSITVIEGSIEYKGVNGISVFVDSGGNSYVDQRTGRAVYPLETLRSSLAPELPLGFDSFYSFKGAEQRNNDIEVTGNITYKD